MATLTLAQVYALARGTGLTRDQAIVATAIARAENRGRPIETNAMGDLDLQTAVWGPSVGPWQIRSLKREYGTGRSRDASRLTDGAFNARAMHEISGAGRDWSPWSTYNDGLYRQFLDDAAKAADGASITPPPTTSPTMPAPAVTSVSLGRNPFDVDVDLPGVLGPLEGPLEGLLKAAGPIVIGGLFVAGGAAIVVAGLWKAAR